ncbi:MAG: hypothetical protein R3Y23_02105 [Bacillota bacterium]
MNRVSIKSVTAIIVFVLILTLCFAVFSVDISALLNKVSGESYSTSQVAEAATSYQEVGTGTVSSGSSSTTYTSSMEYSETWSSATSSTNIGCTEYSSSTNASNGVITNTFTYYVESTISDESTYPGTTTTTKTSATSVSTGTPGVEYASFDLTSVLSGSSTEIADAIAANRIYYKVELESTTLKTYVDYDDAATATTSYWITGYNNVVTSSPSTTNKTWCSATIGTLSTSYILATSSKVEFIMTAHAYAKDEPSWGGDTSAEAKVNTAFEASITVYFMQPEYEISYQTESTTGGEGGTVSITTSSGTTALNTDTTSATVYSDLTKGITISVTPSNGYYFTGFTYKTDYEASGSGGTTIYCAISDYGSFTESASTLFYDSSKSSHGIDITANFAAVTGTDLASETFNYLNTGTGMYVDDPDGDSTAYSVNDVYVGTHYYDDTNDTTVKDEDKIGGSTTCTNTLPITAGSYVYTATYTVTEGETKYIVGVYTNEFSIAQLVRSYTFGSEYMPQDISFGQTIADTNATSSYVSGDQYPFPSNFVYSDDETTTDGSGEWTWAILIDNEYKQYEWGDESVLEVGTYEIVYRFIPDDQYNYAILNITFEVTVTYAFSVDIYNSSALSDETDVNSVKYETSVVDNKPTVTLYATPSEANNYFSFGWMGAANTIGSNYSYDFTGLISSVDSENTNYGISVGTYTGTSGDAIVCGFRAVFMQYYVGDYSFGSTYSYAKNSFTTSYIGAAKQLGLSFTKETSGYLSSSNYSYEEFILLYGTEYATISISKIGTYDATFEITNTALNEVVTCYITCTFIIDYAVIEAEMQTGDADTGWGITDNKYELSTTGAISSAVTSYMYSYSTDNETWTEFETCTGDITADTGCKINFTASVLSGVSSTVYYKFIAIKQYDDEDDIVAKSDIITIKTDTVEAAISASISENVGNWTNDDVVFTFAITYGGSGAELQYYDFDTKDWISATAFIPSDSLAINYGSANYSEAQETTLVFTLSEEQVQYFAFRIVTGTGDIVYYKTLDEEDEFSEYEVMIDKQAPTIDSINLDKDIVDDFWYNASIGASTTAYDKDGATNSGIYSVILYNNDTKITIDPTGDDTDYAQAVAFFIANSATYTVEVTDNAGNVATKTVQAQVDLVEPTISFSGYVGEEEDNITWTNKDIVNGNVTINFEYELGASGITVYYADDTLFGTFDNGNDIAQTITETISYTTEQNASYSFYAVSGSDIKSSEITIYINIDKTAPTIESVDGLEYNNYNDDDGVWTTEDITLSIKVADSKSDVYNSGICSFTVTEGGNIIVLSYDAETGIYSFTLTECAPYTVTITDNAGNVTTTEYQAKIDKNMDDVGVTVSGTYVGDYNGSADNEYAFADSDSAVWISTVTYNDSAYLTMVLNITYTQSGATLQWITSASATMNADAINKLTWTTIADEDKVLSSIGDDTDTRTAENYAIKIDTEEVGYFYLRLVSGSGGVVYIIYDYNTGEYSTISVLSDSGDKDPEITALGYIKLDFTPVAITEVSYVDTVTEETFDTKEDVTNNWNPNAIYMYYTLFEKTSGIASHTLYITDAEGNTTSETLSTATGDYDFEMTAYYTYKLSIVDNAGNETTFEIKPQIDTIIDYDLSVEATYNGSAYTGAWLNNTSDEVTFTFTLNMTDKTFGVSGITIQYSIGGEWIDIASNDDLLFDADYIYYVLFTLKKCQNNTYKFRLINGAGYIIELDGEYVVKKDDVAPNITINALYKDEDNYDDDNKYYYASSTEDDNAEPSETEWISTGVEITWEYTSGVSNATLYRATSTTEGLTYDDLTWTEINSATVAGSNSSTIEIIAETNAVYYYFVVVADGFVNESKVVSICVKIDRTVPTIKVSTTLNGSTYSGAWTYQAVDFNITSISTVNSGYSVEYGYFTYDNDKTAVWNGLDVVTNNTVSLAGDITAGVYMFKVTTGSGIVAYSATSATINIDTVKPEFTLSPSASVAKLDNDYENAGWWIANPTFTYNIDTYGESGYTMQYCIITDGNMGDWSTSGINTTSNSYTITDTSTSGGTEVIYLFRIISGAGVSSVYYDGDDNAWTEEDFKKLEDYDDVAPIKVDVNTYTVTINQYITVYNEDDSEDVAYNYVTINNNNNSNVYYRGSEIQFTIDLAEDAYYNMIYDKNGIYKYIVSINETYKKDVYVSFGTSEVGIDGIFSYVNLISEMYGEDVVIDIYLVKYVELAFDDTYQCLQAGDSTDVDVSVNDDYFDVIFGELDYTITYYNKGETVALSGLPTEIGEYTVRASISGNQNFILNNDDTVTDSDGNKYIEFDLIIVYYSGDGSEDNPYILDNLTDINYINIYMDSDSSYDYLGDNRTFGYYLQTSDINLGSSFTPIANFAGVYDGGGYKVYTETVYTASSDFGFIQYITTNNTQIKNLGVELNVVASGASNNAISVGLLVAQISSYTVMITDCYAIGSISVSNIEQVKVGGLIGYITSTFNLDYEDENEFATPIGVMISSAFVDVDIYANNATGSIGGMVGQVVGVVISSSIVKGNITVVDSYGTIFAGSLIGLYQYYYTITEVYKIFGETDLNSADYYNYILQNNMTVNNTISDSNYNYSHLAFGTNKNGVDFEEAYGIYFVDIEALLSEDDNLTNWSEDELKALANKKAVAMGLSGSGTEADPYQIDEMSDLDALFTMPWAYFQQTADLTATDDFEMLSYDSIFRGTYDGDGNAIYNITFSGSDTYMAMFGIVLADIINLKVIDIDYINNSANTAYVGGLVAVALSGSNFSNIVISGTITVNNSGDEVFVGGLIAVASGVTISSIGVLTNVTVESAIMATVGGVVAQLEGASDETELAISNIYSFANVSVVYSKTGYVGNVFGYIKNKDGSITGSYIYQIPNNTTINGLVSGVGVAYSENFKGSVTNAADYTDLLEIVDKAGNSIVSDLGNYNPFESGTGSASDPFVIVTYEQLLHISDYMYANFSLGADIVIGDYDNDGVVDANYAYDFEPIGNGGIFTGTLNGNYYTITNLTDSLFYTINGSISNLTVNVDYRLYSETDADSYITAKEHDGEDIVFGAIAKYSLEYCNIKYVVVDGIIDIDVSGIISASVGGVVGVNNGGSIRGTITSASISVSAMIADVGGIVGTIYGTSNIEYSGTSSMDYNIIVKNIYVNGAAVNVGLVVGAIRNADAEVVVSNLSDSASVYINGETQGSDAVGYQAKSTSVDSDDADADDDADAGDTEI